MVLSVSGLIRPSSRTGFESTCGVLVDLDGDGDPDLMIGSGGNDVRVDQLHYIVRLYKNDGRGNFTVDPYTFPGNPG